MKQKLLRLWPNRFFDSSRSFSSGCVLMKERFILGKTKGMSATQLRGKVVDDAENVSANIDALVTAEATVPDVMVMIFQLAAGMAP